MIKYAMIALCKFFSFKPISFLNQLKFAISKCCHQETFKITDMFAEANQNVTKDLLEYDAEDIAEELMRLNVFFMSKIHRDEFVGSKWTVVDDSWSNVKQLISNFNSISNWVTITILSGKEVQDRLKIIKKMIDIARISRKKGDFHSVLIIMSSLCHTAIQRMKQTWDKMPAKYMSEYANLHELIQPNASYRVLRQSMQMTPCVPYLGLFLVDLTFLVAGNQPSTLDVINMHLCQLIRDTFTNLNNKIPKENTECIKKEVRDAIIKVIQLPITSDKDIHALALICLLYTSPSPRDA
eukprot:TRINITY_DN8788_c0_g1_i1.p1 TRINITY_DN8788_c0_g1~~TRINITY_DN8788_c0_g1_i1.p1  ORF type:complete len:324 (-),score=50.24 TRINITY_DN8788_c0_g1_i1:4-891(-)